jgi:hypothetical protein
MVARLLLALLLIAALPVDAADLRRVDMAGVRLGMAREEAEAVLARQGGPVSERIERELPKLGRWVQSLLLTDASGLVVEVVLTSPLTGNRVVELTTTRNRNERPPAAVLDEWKAKFGPPTNVLKREGGRTIIAGWGGKAGLEGAIEPLEGQTVTLRLEVSAGATSSATIYDHALGGEDNDRVDEFEARTR